jgi:hypothetical protein
VKLKQLAEIMAKLAETSPNADVYFEKESTPQPREMLRRIGYVSRRDREQDANYTTPSVHYVVLG